MKSWYVWLSVAGFVVPSACSFDREPTFRTANSVMPQPDAASAPVEEPPGNAPASDADVLPAPDAGDPLRIQDAGGSAAQGGGPPDAALPTDSDSASKPSDPPPVPMTGGLQCQGTFCPFAVDPAKPCCTTQADVDRRTTRAADRCGLDLSPLMSDAYGEGCWQRDQLGIVDERCPSVEVVKGLPPEPGCCTDDGLCGSLNADQKLGCRHAPGTERRACSDTPSTASCDPSGTYAVRISVDAVWGGRSGGLVGLTDDGRGEIVVHLLMSIDGVDKTTHALKMSGRVCGFTLPPFYSTTLCESYQPIFPNSIWEAPKVPRPEMRGHFECGPAGCNLSADAVTYLLGFELANPEAPWPRAAQTPSLTCPSGAGGRCFPDDDSDGRPGVQVVLETSGRAAPKGNNCIAGYAYRGAPLSANIAAIFDGVRRTDRVLLGARMKVGYSLRLSDDCGGGRGSAVAEYVNSRAYGCIVEPGTYNFPNLLMVAGENEVCLPEERQFLDENLPEYALLSAGDPPPGILNLSDRMPSRGPLASVRRIAGPGEAVSCEAVRAANDR